MAGRARGAAKETKWDRRRQAAIEAAAAVFAEKGYHEATTREIAERLGLLPGSLYYYFPSKEAALIEVCRYNGALYNARLLAVAEGALPFEGKVREGMRLHIRHNSADLVSAFALSNRELPDNAVAELRALGREYFALWERIMRAADAPAMDVPGAVIALLALCNGSVDWYQGRGPKEVDRMAEKLADRFLFGLLPRA